MYFTHAITRKPGINFARGLTASTLGSADYELISEQHDAYMETLRSTGLEVLVLEAQPDYPDAHFVEDTAVLTPDVAVITRPGAETRQGEENTIAQVLTHYRKTVHIQAPGTLDGGDVLMVGNHFFISISKRTNPEGAEQLGKILEAYGFPKTKQKLESLGLDITELDMSEVRKMDGGLTCWSIRF
jgi:dimethylargininase